MKDHFQKILGLEHALDNENDLLAYSYDGSGLEGKARLVLFPQTDEHIRHILTWANRTNIPVVPRGLGGNPVGAAIPDNALVLDMSAFDRIHTLNLKEGYVLVDSGVVLSDLQTLLAKHEYKFCIDPESRNVATIGALLALNQMDRQSHKYGRIQEHVLSMEMIDGTGKYYPEGNLDFIGMEGTGAIILRAKIKIRPITTETTMDVLTFKEIVDVVACVDEKNQDLTVLSIEYMNPLASKLVGLPETHHVLVEYTSDKGSYVNQEGQRKYWEKRMGVWDASTKHGNPVIEDCSVPHNKLYDVITYCEENNLPLAGHIGMGILHPFFPPGPREEYYEFINKIGSPAGQFGHGLLKKKYVPETLKDKHLKLKDEYDYNDIVNRGVIHDYA